MAGAARYDKALAGFDVMVCAFDVEHHLAVDNLDKGIVGSEMLGELLTSIETEERHAAGLTVDKLLADNTALGIIDQLIGYKHFSFLKLHSLFTRTKP